MNKIFAILLAMLSCASVYASNRNSVDLGEENTEKQKYSFVINAKSDQYKDFKFKSIKDMNGEKKGSVHSLIIRDKSGFQIVLPENLPNILSTCSSFKNLNTLDLKDFCFQEKYIEPINNISSLRNIKIDIWNFDLISKSFKTLVNVENIFILARDEGLYDCNVRALPENFKTIANKLDVRISNYTQYRNILSKCGLPPLGGECLLESGSRINAINFDPETEMCSFSKSGIISKKEPLTRYLNIHVDNKGVYIYIDYFSKEEINCFLVLFNQNEDMPFQYMKTDGEFRFFTRKK